MRPATGMERAALVLLALGETHGAPIWNELNEQEIALLTETMARLGTVDPGYVQAALQVFHQEMSGDKALLGSPLTAEMLLSKVLPEDKAGPLVDRLRRPSGPGVWERLAGLKVKVLADYLAGEHPQTAALILSQLPSEHTARVIGELPHDFSLDCLDRMMRIEEVDRRVLEAIEEALNVNLIAPHSGPSQAEPAERIANIFNLIDRSTGAALMERWRKASQTEADRVRSLMFTFEDFAKLSPVAIQTLLKSLDRDLLVLALKAANQDMRNVFMEQMSARASRMLENQIDSLGSVRLKEAQMAQAKVIAYARALEEKGELSLRAPSEETEEMIP